ncbi:antioxidant, AhpC/TSA family [Dictyocaulus viviparus]|uniref:protein-disulfide reductase n=1 Tax=Dictyocaulus viviparus TaxID=29172 RepID=A0A0D8XGJ6_DICVI|nr:antioxidant, AhpC/TSA family [Dictyocaulus viviparus]
MDSFIGKPLIGSDGSEVDASTVLQGKMIALYFSAMWCAQCRQFTPKLSRFYHSLKEAGKNFEIILVSRDREEDDFIEYLTEHCGGWYGIPFGDDRINKLLAKYEVSSIPVLKVLNVDGTVIVEDARSQITDKGRDEPIQLFEDWKKIL